MEQNKIYVQSLLRKKYPPGEFALLEEVRDAAGFSASRSADFITIGLWPSRGHPVTGFEMKASRSDWLRELKNSAKAENIFQYCDYFYLLITDEKIAQLAEVPKTWGLMCVRNEKLKVLKEAPKLEPKPLTRSFICAMLKRADSIISKMIHPDELKKKVEEHSEHKVKDLQDNADYFKNQAQGLRESIKEFEKTSGVKFNDWQAGDIGEAVHLVLNGGLTGIETRMKRMKETADEISKAIDNQMKKYEQAIGGI